MKKEHKVLTYNQARELKFFCNNVTGVREDFYEIIDATNALDARLKRLEDTAELINKFLEEQQSDEKAPGEL